MVLARRRLVTVKGLRPTRLRQLRLRSCSWTTLEPVTSDGLLPLSDVVEGGSIDGLVGMLLGLSRGATLHRTALAGELLLSRVDLGDGLAVQLAGVRLGSFVLLRIL